MASQVKLNWQSFEFIGSEAPNWKSLKKIVDFDEHENLLSTRAVYVIRVGRPFAFSYGTLYSPVVYIGKGQAQVRITSHLRTWIRHLCRKIPDLAIKIYYCEPKVRYHGTICEGVEADLIAKFKEYYGSLPLRNRNTPTEVYERVYSKADQHVLHPGKGPGYHWALAPLPSSHFYKE